jgi:hypothetical protein
MDGTVADAGPYTGGWPVTNRHLFVAGFSGDLELVPVTVRQAMLASVLHGCGWYQFRNQPGRIYVPIDAARAAGWSE